MEPETYRLIEKEGLIHWSLPNNLDSILENGIIPQGSSRVIVPDLPHLRSRDGYVYLAREMNGPVWDLFRDRVPVHVNLDLIDLDRIEADEDYLWTAQNESDYGYPDLGNAEDTGRWADIHSHVMKDPDVIRDSYLVNGTLAYRGTIPAEALRAGSLAV